MRVLLDCDGVLADYIGFACQLVNRKFKDEEHLPDHYEYGDFTAKHWAYIRGEFDKAPLCTNIPWYPGAKKFLNQLLLKHSVRIVTKPQSSEGWEEQRREWLSEVIDPRHVIFESDKRNVEGDILIEDDVLNAHSWSARQGKQALLMHRYWNRHMITGMYVVRAYSYKNIESYLNYLTNGRFT